MSLAWHVEAFARMKKLPSLAKVLGRPEAQIATEQTDEEILAAMRAWAAMSKEAVAAAG